MPTLFHIKLPVLAVKERIPHCLAWEFGFSLHRDGGWKVHNGKESLVVKVPDTGLSRCINILAWFKSDTLLYIDEPPEVDDEAIKAFLWADSPYVKRFDAGAFLLQAYARQKLSGEVWGAVKAFRERKIDDPNWVSHFKKVRSRANRGKFLGMLQYDRRPQQIRRQERVNEAWLEIGPRLRRWFYSKFNHRWEVFYRILLESLGGSGKSCETDLVFRVQLPVDLEIGPPLMERKPENPIHPNPIYPWDFIHQQDWYPRCLWRWWTGYTSDQMALEFNVTDVLVRRHLAEWRKKFSYLVAPGDSDLRRLGIPRRKKSLSE